MAFEVEAVVFTQEELEARCKLWQERLRLQDWDVRPSLAKHWEMRSTHALGNIYINQERKEADLFIIDAAHRQPDAKFPFDQEQVLVHELLHLHLEPMGVKNDTPEQKAEEQAINAITAALLKAYRRIEELEAA